MDEDKKEQNTANTEEETSVKEENSADTAEEGKQAETQNSVSDSTKKEEKAVETQEVASPGVEKKDSEQTDAKESTEEKTEEKKDENTEKVEKEESKTEDQSEKSENESVEEAKKEDDTTNVSKSEKIYPDVVTGANVKIHQKIKEKKGKEEKERIQIFEGIVLARKGGSSIGATITVRKICKGGFEVKKIFPLHSPVIAKIEVLRQAKVRQSKLGFFKRTYKKKLKYV